MKRPLTNKQRAAIHKRWREGGYKTPPKCDNCGAFISYKRRNCIKCGPVMGTTK